MSRIKKRKFFDEEAVCKDDSEDFSEEDDDDDNSLADFIDDGVEEDIPLPPKPRGRPTEKQKKKEDIFKPPGDSAYPINDFSLTITKTKDDVGLDALESIAKFIEEKCLKGGVSTEVGQRVFQLHLQSVFRIHWPSHKEFIQRLQKILKALLPANGKLYKVLLKPFTTNQTFSAMVGYITKDQGILFICCYTFAVRYSNYLLPFAGQAHYQIRTHNVSRQELSFGRRDHDALLTSFDDAKKILTMKNMFNECYKFNMRCIMHPAVIPIHYAILYMIQSGGYILSPDFISIYKKISLSEAQILWKMTFTPVDTKLCDALTILFNPLSYGKKVSFLLCFISFYFF